MNYLINLCSIKNFKSFLIIFYFFWWGVALWTDIVGGFAHLGWLQASWAPDTNYPALVEALKMYTEAAWLPAVFFIMIIAASAVSTLLFALASVGVLKKQPSVNATVIAAYVFSLFFWCSFFLADQVTMKFGFEENHMVQASFQFLAFLFTLLVPDEVADEGA